ncbi:hypothetical protein T484DRAFT_3040750 [Baffinella frigidus]|nr:hypothetical protein T484DRAFT_3040750 [Cryptophyta sp. CCMP2293]
MRPEAGRGIPRAWGRSRGARNLFVPPTPFVSREPRSDPRLVTCPTEAHIRASSSVRLCWELEEPKGPRGHRRVTRRSTHALEHPWNTPGTPLERPWSSPETPPEHPCSSRGALHARRFVRRVGRMGGWGLGRVGGGGGGGGRGGGVLVRGGGVACCWYVVAVGGGVRIHPENARMSGRHGVQ